ncbi:MAG: hypothetical protein R3D99_08260 [Altererythrobacter sp.]
MFIEITPAIIQGQARPACMFQTTMAYAKAAKGTTIVSHPMASLNLVDPFAERSAIAMGRDNSAAAIPTNAVTTAIAGGHDRVMIPQIGTVDTSGKAANHQCEGSKCRRIVLTSSLRATFPIGRAPGLRRPACTRRSAGLS